MSQKTLEDFFVFHNPIKKHSLKKYFYVRFSNRYCPDYQAVWLDTRPKEINFIEEVKCNYFKKEYGFYLCGYFPNYEERKYQLRMETKYKNIPYLKSHLQKCVRKQNDQLAIPTAYHFMKLDIQEFIRRLPIIMIEDVSLHESFTTILWLMIAFSSTSFKAHQYIYEWLLGVVHLLCNMNEKDSVSKNETLVNQNIADTLNSYLNLNSEKNISLLYSFHLRCAYGGMNGDMIMLKSYAEKWYERFQNSIQCDKRPIRPIIINVMDLDLGLWDLSAIDFHCNSRLLDIIEKKYPEYSKEELKKIIWVHSSSINRRDSSRNIWRIDDWNIIKDYVQKTQKYLLDSSY